MGLKTLLLKYSFQLSAILLATPLVDAGDSSSWLTVISDLGFPIVVAAFLLFVLNRTLERQRLALVDLTVELRVGQHIIIEKLNAMENYEAELAKEKLKQAKAEDFKL